LTRALLIWLLPSAFKKRGEEINGFLLDAVAQHPLDQGCQTQTTLRAAKASKTAELKGPQKYSKIP